MNDPMTVEEAMRLKKHYVCSQCWGEFVITFKHGQATVTCDKCGEIEHFVTRKYVQSRLEKSVWDYCDARENLKQFINRDIQDDKTKSNIRAIAGKSIIIT